MLMQPTCSCTYELRLARERSPTIVRSSIYAPMAARRRGARWCGLGHDRGVQSTVLMRDGLRDIYRYIYIIQLTQTQTAMAQDLTGAARRP